MNEKFSIKYIVSLAFAGYFLLVSSELKSQEPSPISIQVAPTDNIEELVLEEFIKKNNCIEISNITTIGQASSIGSFSNGSQIIGMEEGIAFTTGKLEDIPGPNIAIGKTGHLGNQAAAPYLGRILSNVPFFDMVGIEFDFTPTSDFVSFNYVFASEEYCEYVGSEFNDAFGFFVSGPGIDGGGYNNSLNVAQVQEKNEPVTINNVNHLKNSNFFVNNLTKLDAITCNIQESPKNLEAIEFDGFTTKLQAFFSVIPCETYHIRLVVADVSDDMLDSAVFLEGKSFDSGAKARIRVQVNGKPDSLVYENCLAGNFIIDRSKLSDRNNPLTVNLAVLGTATNGQDFSFIPSSIVVDPNQFRMNLPVTIIKDNEEEGEEYVDVIVVTKTCDCEERDTARLYIRDSKDSLSVFFEETFVCQDQTFSLTPMVPDGIDPLLFEWATGDTSSTITDIIDEPANYAVTITDFCGASNSAAVHVELQDIPELTIDTSLTWCEGRPPKISLLDLPGHAPWTISYTIDNQSIATISDIQEDPFPFPYEQVGLYDFTGFTDQNCTGIISGSALVEDVSFQIDLTSSSPSCTDGNDGQISLEIVDGEAPFNVWWNNDQTDQLKIDQLIAGDYIAQVSDQSGCIVTEFVTIPPAPAFSNCKLDLTKNLFVPNAFSPNGDGINDTFTIYPKFGLIQSVSFKIFDRWGGLIFESKAINSPQHAQFWDGKKYHTGVYFCLVDIILANGEIQKYGKDVTLVY